MFVVRGGVTSTQSYGARCIAEGLYKSSTRQYTKEIQAVSSGRRAYPRG